ncbi:MAG TPA: helix-turn-helix transcriptional regulator [Bacteroidia bacterium]|nr:helix-turn-helix transcriptional regulator [Bacteroidia bacterium]
MAVHIGKIVRKHLEEAGMTKSEFARRLETSPQNIYGIFKRKSIDTELLKEISAVLNYDFFQYYSTGALLVHEDKANYGKIMTALDLQREVNKLKQDLEILKNENQYLKEIHQLMKEKQGKKEK